MGIDQMSSSYQDSEGLENAVGRRVSCGEERGTVRYVGTVPPTAGLWLGIEWDNTDRGKHDGSHEGVRYFTCKHPTGGSFVRPKKANFGVDFPTALREKYWLEEQQSKEEVVFSRPVEKVGFTRLQKKFENLTIVALKAEEVNGPGPEDAIRKAAPNITELNLCGNLLASWCDVAAICQQMAHLTELMLSYNRLSIPSDPASLHRAFSNLRVLSLTNSALTWTQLLECAPMWPQVEALYLSENDITQLHRPQDVLQSLRVLDLTGNKLMHDSLLSIAHLPRLETLNISSTGLSSLCFHDVPPGGKTCMFPALHTLILENNCISEWCVINELDKLQSLSKLSCRHNPLLSDDGNPETTRQLLIAKLGQLDTLNRYEIQPQDRRGAELDYIKMFGKAWLKAGGHRDPEKNRPSPDFTNEHPQYQTIIEKYGAPEEGELKSREPVTLKNELISLTFMCPEEPDRKPVVKKLPDSMDVHKVRGLLYRLLKVPGAELKLSYTSSKREGIEVEINNDMKPLKFYSIEDGDTVLVRWS